MIFLSRWIKDRLRIKKSGALEVERRIQQAKRDDERTQALLLSFRELQRTMDPLIAAQVYNERFCPLISRLPEELLLCILDFVCEDVVALHCLRIVSRIFRRLLHYESKVWAGVRDLDCTALTRPNVFLDNQAMGLQFRRLLQRDERCNNCKRWNDTNGRTLFDECKFRQTLRSCYHLSTLSDAIDPLLYRKLYCYACKTQHDICQFPSNDKYALWRRTEPNCLGQRGSVDLCEHVQITWASVQAHIDRWRQQQHGGNWETCLDSFNIECHHPSHDTRCTPSEASTWPRATLSTSSCDVIVLILEWTPHSRIDASNLTANGHIPAPELRALFQRLRSLGPADSLYTPWRSGFLPEMVFFSPSSRLGRIFNYKTGEDDQTDSPPVSLSLLQSGRLLRLLHFWGHGKNGKKLEIRSYRLGRAHGIGLSEQCLVVNYIKHIMLCKTTIMTDHTIKLVPTNHWLHAIDTDTYPYPCAPQNRPKCRDESCTNFYRRRKNYYSWPPFGSDDV